MGGDMIRVRYPATILALVAFTLYALGMSFPSTIVALLVSLVMAIEFSGKTA